MKESDECVVWREQLFNTIPVICISKKSEEKQKLVLLYHQFLDRKESMLNFAYRLAEYGFFTVCIDIDRHGDRSNFENKFPARELYNVLFDTAEEVVSVIDYYCENHHILPDNISVLGVSLGGKVAITASMMDNRITHVVALLSSPNFPEIAKRHNEKVLSRFFADNAQCDETYIQEINVRSKLLDPYYNIDKFASKNSLLINGLLDTTFPIEIIKDFQQKLQSSNSAKDTYHDFEFISKAGHQLNNGMIHTAIQWITKNNG